MLSTGIIDDDSIKYLIFHVQEKSNFAFAQAGNVDDYGGPALSRIFLYSNIVMHLES